MLQAQDFHSFSKLCEGALKPLALLVTVRTTGLRLRVGSWAWTRRYELSLTVYVCLAPFS